SSPGSLCPRSRSRKSAMLQRRGFPRKLRPTASIPPLRPASEVRWRTTSSGLFGSGLRNPHRNSFCRPSLLTVSWQLWTSFCRLSPSTVDCSSSRPHVRIRRHLARLLAIFVVALWCVAMPAPFLSAASRRPKQHPSPALNARLDEILSSSDASRGFWGIEVGELPSGRILFSRDAQHLFHPASNMKLFTTAAALEKLGPDFVFRTTVESESVPDAQGRV